MEEEQNKLDELEKAIAVKKQSEVTPESTISNFQNQTLMQIQDDFKTGKVSADDGMKQIVNVLTIIEATADPELRKELRKEASNQMKSYMKGISYKDEENKIAYRQKRNEAFYKAFRPILEFDLSHLIGKKKKKVVTKDNVTGKKIVSYEAIPDEPVKTYADRSYGLMLMFVMILLFIVPYCVANIVLAIGRMINAMFECFAQFGNTAFWLCTSIAGIAIIMLIIYVIILVIQAAFGVQILAP